MMDPPLVETWKRAVVEEQHKCAAHCGTDGKQRW